MSVLIMCDKENLPKWKIVWKGRFSTTQICSDKQTSGNQQNETLISQIAVSVCVFWKTQQTFLRDPQTRITESALILVSPTIASFAVQRMVVSVLFRQKAAFKQDSHLSGCVVRD